MKALLAAACAWLFLMLPLQACAYPPLKGVYGGSGVISATAPVLANVSVPFGALTQAGQGGVSLASRDVSSYGFPFKGLDLWDGNTAHTPVSWTITDTTSTSGYTPGAHWELDGTTTCKATATVVSLAAPTPRPCAAGVTAHLNKGPYTFSIVATDVEGHASAPVTFTYDTTATNMANTANFGDQAADATATAIPAAWKTGSMPLSATIALSTGANWISKGGRLIFKTLDFTLGAAHPVTFTWADAVRPGGLWEVELLGVKNFILNGLTFTGPAFSPSGYWIEITKDSSNNLPTAITLQDVAITKTANDLVNGDTSKGLSVFNGSNITINNFKGRYLPTCIEWGNGVTNVTFNNTVCRYIYVNFADTSNFTGVTLNDTYLISPMRVNAQHTDTLQLANATLPSGLTVNHMMSVQADGDAVSQGPIFSGRPGTGVGYIDDSANGNPGLPGNTFTLMSLPTGAEQLGFTATGMTLISETDTLGHVIAPGTMTTTTCPKPTGPVPHPQCQFSGAPQLLGSAASPVQVWTTPTTDLKMNGIIYAGGSLAGDTAPTSAGTTFLKNFTYVKSNGYNNGEDLAHVSIPGSLAVVTVGANNWNVLTASGPATGNQVGLYFAEHVTWDQVSGKPCNPNTTFSYTANCPSTGNVAGPAISGGSIIGGTNPSGLATPTGTGVGGAGATYVIDKTPNFGTVSNKIFDFRFDYALSGGPKLNITSTDSTLLHSGTYEISSGFLGDGLFFTKVNGTLDTTPSWLTLSHVTSAGLSASGFLAAHNTAEAAFKNGDPQVSLDAIPTATWRAMTDAQVVAAYVSALLPKTSGPLDAGGGAWYGALTQDGHWNDGSGKTP